MNGYTFLVHRSRTEYNNVVLLDNSYMKMLYTMDSKCEHHKRVLDVEVTCVWSSEQSIPLSKQCRLCEGFVVFSFH